MSWRLSRRVYIASRGDLRGNDIATNGESYVQRCVLDATAAGSETLRVCDIGANEGEWTLSLLAQMPASRKPGAYTVDLFEPVPSTAARLRTFLEKAPGPAAALRIHNLALSDQAGHVRMAIMSQTGGTNSIHYDGSAGETPPGGYADVETMTLTEFARSNRIERFDLVKCDTEGHDSKVIAGARPLLAERRIAVLQFEYNHRWILARSFLKDVFDTVSGLPYHVARIMPGHIELLPVWHPELDRFFEANYLLVRDDALTWFDARAGRFDDTNTYA